MSAGWAERSEIHRFPSGHRPGIQALRYIGRRFRNDTEHLEKLFEMYTKMTKQKGAA